MSQTKAGAAKARETLYKKYGKDFYGRIGGLGGLTTGVPKGFASEKVGADGLTGKERAAIAGAKGGSISKRTK